MTSLHCGMFLYMTNALYIQDLLALTSLYMTGGVPEGGPREEEGVLDTLLGGAWGAGGKLQVVFCG